MLSYILRLSVLTFGVCYATTNCVNCQQSQMAFLNERINKMIGALYSSPLFSSLQKAKSTNTTPPAPPFEIYPDPPPYEEYLSLAPFPQPMLPPPISMLSPPPPQIVYMPPNQVPINFPQFYSQPYPINQRSGYPIPPPPYIQHPSIEYQLPIQPSPYIPQPPIEYQFPHQPPPYIPQPPIEYQLPIQPPVYAPQPAIEYQLPVQPQYQYPVQPSPCTPPPQPIPPCQEIKPCTPCQAQRYSYNVPTYPILEPPKQPASYCSQSYPIAAAPTPAPTNQYAQSYPAYSYPPITAYPAPPGTLSPVPAPATPEPYY